jgi:hypothetical protein
MGCTLVLVGLEDSKYRMFTKNFYSRSSWRICLINSYLLGLDLELSLSTAELSPIRSIRIILSLQIVLNCLKIENFTIENFLALKIVCKQSTKKTRENLNIWKNNGFCWQIQHIFGFSSCFLRDSDDLEII